MFLFLHYFSSKNNPTDITNLLDEDFNPNWINQAPESATINLSAESDLTGLSWPTNTDLLTGEFMPSKLLQESLNFLELDISTQTDNTDEIKNLKTKISEKNCKKDSSNTSQVSWLSLFAELDPLANQNISHNTAGDRA